MTNASSPRMLWMLPMPFALAGWSPETLVVDAERQTAIWLEAGVPVAAWPVSTAQAGIGGEEGSYRTPPAYVQ